MGMIRVLIVDDHPIIRELLTQYVESASDLEIVAQTHNGREAVAMARDSDPDVVLMDLSLPVMDGISATHHITMHTKARVLILSSLEGERDVLRALHCGAHGYMTKDSPADEVLSALRKVHDGGLVFNNRIARLLGVGHETTQSETKGLIKRFTTGTRITGRQMTVLRGVCRGQSNGDIADELGISHSSVNTYISRLYDKLEADNRVELYKAAVEQGLVEPPLIRP